MPSNWFNRAQANESPDTTPVEDDDANLGMTDHEGSSNHSGGMEVVDLSPDFAPDHTMDTCELKDGYWVCQPYKQEIIQQQLDANSPGATRRTAIIGALRDLGVKVFIIEAKSIDSTADILHHVKRVVGFVARENRVLGKAVTGLGFQRCLLYQDRYGRLLNLTLAAHAAGPAGKFQDYLDSFSGTEAMVALTVLARSFPCATSDDLVDSLRPAYLSLILGLVLTEEISLSWLNASMLVRASPSVSAHVLMNGTGSDFSRKAVVLSLALAGAASGKLQKYMTIFGISLACLVLLANLGSRAWFFMKWKPLRYQGPGAGVLAYAAAVATGIVMPYMGHRSMEIGGKAGLEHVVRTALIVAIVFCASDIDELQKFLIVGSEQCDQDYVNIAVGGWWALTLLISLFLARKIPYHDAHPNYDGEPLLIADQISPVGFKVPSLPDFSIDPGLAQTGLSWVSLRVELMTGIFVALVCGAGIVYLGFTEWDETLVEEVEAAAADLF